MVEWSFASFISKAGARSPLIVLAAEQTLKKIPEGRACTLVKLGRFKEALEVFDLIEKRMDDGKDEQHMKSTYMNYRYLVPLCYVRIGDFQGCLKFLKRNVSQIVLHSTGLSFLLAGAFVQFKLGIETGMVRLKIGIVCFFLKNIT